MVSLFYLLLEFLIYHLPLRLCLDSDLNFSFPIIVLVKGYLGKVLRERLFVQLSDTPFVSFVLIFYERKFSLTSFPMLKPLVIFFLNNLTLTVRDHLGSGPLSVFPDFFCRSKAHMYRS